MITKYEIFNKIVTNRQLLLLQGVVLLIGVVEVVIVSCNVAVMLDDATLIAAADVGDVFSTEPLFCLLNDEDVLFVLAQNFSFVCTVCHCGFTLLF